MAAAELQQRPLAAVRRPQPGRVVARVQGSGDGVGVLAQVALLPDREDGQVDGVSVGEGSAALRDGSRVDFMLANAMVSYTFRF